MANEPDDKTIDDGGPAFATPQVLGDPGDDEFASLGQRGMSVRMWLAGQNHAAMLGGGNFNLNPQEMSDLALRHADALIRESKK